MTVTLMPENRIRIAPPNLEILESVTKADVLRNGPRIPRTQMIRNALTVAVDVVRQEVTMNKLWPTLD